MNRAAPAILLGVVAAVTVASGAWWARRSVDTIPSASRETQDVGPVASRAGADLSAAPAKPPDYGPAACSIAGIIRRAGRPVVASVEARRAEGAVRLVRMESRPDSEPGSLVPRESPVVARTSSGADGRFAFPALPTGAYAVRALTNDGARGATSVILHRLAQREETLVEVVSATSALRGAVSYEGATPFRGVVYVVALPDLRGHWDEDESDDDAADFESARVDVREVQTNERGEFEATELTPGDTEVVVVDGAFRATARQTVPAAQTMKIELPRQADKWEGRVVDRATGQPVVGASITFATPGRELAFRWIRTSDDAGRFSLPAASYGWMTVRAPGLASDEQMIGVQHPREVRVELDRVATIRGRATLGADGGPAAGVVIEASTTTRWSSSLPDGRAITDAEGRYEIGDLAPGDIKVRVHDARGVARGMADLSIEDLSHPIDYDPFAVRVAPGGEARLDLVIEPAARIGGRLTDAERRPVAGAAVRAQRPENFTMSGNPRPAHSWSIARAVTDEDGRFRLSDLVPGWEYRVVASRGAQRAFGGATAPAGGTEIDVALAFDASQTLDLRAVDSATGSGIAGLTLIVQPKEWGLSWRGRTGDDGTLRAGPMARAGVEVVAPASTGWFVEKATATIAASSEGSAPTVSTVRVTRIAPNDSPTPATAQLSQLVAALESAKVSRAANPLAVRVVDPEGRPVPRADLGWEFRRDGDGNLGGGAVIDGFATVPRKAESRTVTWLDVTDARGADGTMLPLGPAHVGPIADGTSETEVRLPAAKWIVGRVVDAQSRGVVGLRVRLAVPGEHRHVSFEDRKTVDRTDAEGRFQIKSLADDEQVLVVVVPDRYVSVSPIEARFGGDPIEVRLHPSVSARVTVIDAAQNPLAGLRVVALDSGRDRRGSPNVGWWPRNPDGRTDALGVAIVRGLDPEATYSLNVEVKRPDGPDRQWWRYDWSPADTSVEVREERVIRGIVRDLEGEPLADADVVGFAGGRWVTSATTEADGSFSLKDVGTPGLRLYATMAHGHGVESQVIDPPTGDEAVTIPLDRGQELSLRLVGDRVGDRTVLLMAVPGDGWPANSDYQDLRTDAAGRVRFRGVRPNLTYVAWVAPSTTDYLSVAKDSGETTAFATGLTPGSASSEFEVRLQPGLVLIARPPAGVSWERPSVRAAHGRMMIEGAARSDGAFEFRGLCDVEWDVVVEERGGGKRYEVKGRPGGAEFPLVRAEPKTPR